MNALKPLYDDQIVGIDLLKQSFLAGNTRVAFQAPCGYGKTVLAAHIVAGARQKHNRVVFCAPAIGLIDQTFSRFVENGFDPSDMGVIQADHPWRRPHAPIQIATPQTLAARDLLPEADVVIFDEGHEWFEVYTRWLAYDGPGKPKIFIVLSATPWNKGLGTKLTDLVRPIPMADLIAKGRLSPFKVFAPSKPDLSGVKTRQTQFGTDYVESEAAERMNQPKLIGNIVENWLERARGMPTLCFATGVQHAQSIRDRFAEAGVRVGYIDANTPREDRDALGKELESGETEVVVNIGTCTRGIDWIVRCLLMCRATKSDILFTQIMGRVLRPEFAPGFDLSTTEGRLAAIAAGPKPTALIFDHSDTHMRLGMVTDVEARHDQLDDGKTKAKAKAKPKEPPLPKECHVCACLVPAHEDECPNCGATRPKPVFVEGAGALSEFNGERQQSTGVFSAKRRGGESVTDALMRLGPEQCYAQIRWVQEERGRQDGWSAHKYRELWGDWPPRPWKRQQPEEACSLMRSWIRSRDIAWAKSRDREVAA
jgi:DNA repair protein RadD